MGRGRSDDRGSAGVWVLALSGVLLLASAASVLAGLAIIGRHQAGTAADLAALAAAGQALSGPEVACGLAERIARSNGAQLASCVLAADGIADVEAIVPLRFGSLGLAEARAAARAGPVDADDTGRRSEAERALAAPTTGHLPHQPTAAIDQLVRRCAVCGDALWCGDAAR